MRERGVAILSILAVVAPMVAIAAVAGSRVDLYVAWFAAGTALLAAIHVWGWARCRSWPEVRAVVELADTPTSTEKLQLVYTYAESAYSRPAQTRGAVGSSLTLKVDPRDPSLSSLVVPRPDLSIAVLVVASFVLISSAVHAVSV